MSGIALSNQVIARSRDLPWYDSVVKLDPAARDLLQHSSKIQPNEIESHIYTVRDEAWDVWPYPCIGQFRFLNLTLAESSYYPSLLELLKPGKHSFLDLGCCFGQDLRKLVHDGVPSDKLYGSDLRGEYFEVGFNLFRDRDTFRGKFIEADVMNQSETPGEGLSTLDGIIDVVNAASFIHLFDYDDQLSIIKRIIKLLRPVSGSMLVGSQVGNINAGRHQGTVVVGRKAAHDGNISMEDEDNFMFLHNAESFAGLWERASEETGTKWDVNAYLVQKTPSAGALKLPGAFGTQTMRVLTFKVTRL